MPRKLEPCPICGAFVRELSPGCAVQCTNDDGIDPCCYWVNSVESHRAICARIGKVVAKGYVCEGDIDKSEEITTAHLCNYGPNTPPCPCKNPKGCRFVEIRQVKEGKG